MTLALGFDMPPLMPVLADASWLINLMPAAGLVLILMSVIMWGRKRRARTQSDLGPRERHQRSREQRAVRGDMDQLMVEIEQLAKRMGSQLDAKAMHLERLLREADAKIAALQRLEQGGDEPAPPRRSGAATEPGASADGPCAPAGDDRAEAETTGPDATATAAAAADDAAIGDERKLAASVYELADEGLSPVQIARKLDEHVGKIELMLALRE